MIWEVVWEHHAVADMRRLDRPIAARVHAAVRQLAETGRGDIKRLHGVTDEWRLRAGSWRVRLTFKWDDGVIVVLRALPRGEAYR